MLGAEEPAEVRPEPAHHVDRVAPFGGHRGGVGHEPHPPPRERGHSIDPELLEAHAHAWLARESRERQQVDEGA
jgi:hypothetical protein